MDESGQIREPCWQTKPNERRDGQTVMFHDRWKARSTCWESSDPIKPTAVRSDPQACTPTACES